MQFVFCFSNSKNLSIDVADMLLYWWRLFNELLVWDEEILKLGEVQNPEQEFFSHRLILIDDLKIKPWSWSNVIFCTSLSKTSLWSFPNSTRYYKRYISWIGFQTGVELELVESQSLLEWFANHYKDFGATLEIITDKSQEGAQFVKGFGGIGG